MCAHVFRVERPAPEPKPEPEPPPADDAWTVEPEPAPPPADDTWTVEHEPFAGDVETGGTESDGSTSIAAGAGPEDGAELPDWATGLDAEGPEDVTDAPEEPRPEPTGWTDPAPEEPRPEPTGWTDPTLETADWGEPDDEPDPLPIMEAQPAPVTDPEPSPTPEPETVPGFSFGKRDPMDKARRLARVLVSDMVMYNSERHQVALSRGTLAEDFQEEIDKSWKEYVDQIGSEIAEGEGRHFWSQALNDILAKGAKVF